MFGGQKNGVWRSLCKNGSTIVVDFLYRDSQQIKIKHRPVQIFYSNSIWRTLCDFTTQFAERFYLDVSSIHDVRKTVHPIEHLTTSSTKLIKF